MPAGVGYSKKDLTGVRAKLEALMRKKKRGKAHSRGMEPEMMDGKRSIMKK